VTRTTGLSLVSLTSERRLNRLGSRPVLTANLIRLTIGCESAENRCHGRSLQLDLVRRARAVPIWDALQAEIVVLPHQLNVLRRKSPERIAFTNIDRLVFAGL
jgi:hypothetical protein